MTSPPADVGTASVARPSRTSLANGDALIVAFVALALALAADPRGNFPLNDDWAYAHSVQWLLAEHRIRLSDWAAMNLLPQTLAGGVVAMLAGFSFESLRHLTQLVSVGVAVLALWWFRAVGLGRPASCVATLTLVAMPCWLPLAESFMTDLYAIAFALPAATLFVQALRAPTRKRIALATLLAALGMLQRQVVLVVPLAFGVAWIAAWFLAPPPTRTSPARRLATAVVPVLVVVAVEFAYRAYLASGPGIPSAQRVIHERVLDAIARTIDNDGGYYRHWVVSNAFAIAAYIALFAAPFALWHGTRGRPARAGLLLVAAIAVLAMALTGFWPPWRGNHVVDAAGIGPFTLYDAQPRGLFPLDRSAGPFWIGVGVLAASGFAALCRVGWVALRAVAARRDDTPLLVFLVTMTVAYVAPFVLTDFTDRYLLFVLPFVLALIAIAEPPGAGLPRRALAIVVIIAALVIEALAVHDYFAWNRARWDAIRDAQAQGATPSTLDGGFEYNGYFGYEARLRTREDRQRDAVGERRGRA
ncbi:MAG TPA: hypothetical protein VGL90_02695 [Casimicrobiaceae bacterium]